MGGILPTGSWTNRPCHHDRFYFEGSTTRFDFRRNRVGYQDAPYLFKWALKQISQHRTVFHALKRPRQVASVAFHLDFDGDEPLVLVAQNDINAIPRAFEGEFHLI
jgi:hypothetical protein